MSAASDAPLPLPTLPPGTDARPLGPAPARSALAAAWALVRGRCPRCLRGRIFAGTIAMNRSCAECGLAFGRGPGYYVGAMYFGYAAGILGIGGFLWLLATLFPAWSWTACVVVATLAFLPFVPASFRASRVIWIYFDRFFDPSSPQ